MQNGEEIVSISFVHRRDPNYMTSRENKELENRNVFTLNLSTSSMRAVLPEVTQVWKNEGATLDRRVIFFIHFFYFFYFFKFFCGRKREPRWTGKSW